MNTQKDWRQEKRIKRQNLSKEEKVAKSLGITKKLLATETYRRASSVGAYLSMSEEVDVKTIIEQAWNDGKTVYLPVVEGWGKALKFASYTPQTQLIKDILDIKIPNVDASDYVSADKLDMVVTPLVAFDRQCNRIGMGGGFYDRTFEKKLKDSLNAVLVGVAFDIQCVDRGITTNPWDVKPDMIITERKIYYPQNDS